jgi:hypothetical protein
MCGIFGIVGPASIEKNDLLQLVNHSRQRGRDSSGLIHFEQKKYIVNKADYDVNKLLNKVKPLDAALVLGHSRLITNGLGDNQPVVRGDIIVLHNGIIVNDDNVWESLSVERTLDIDSEVIAGVVEEHIKKEGLLEDVFTAVLEKCSGIIACAILLPKLGKLVLFSNNGSLYVGEKKGFFFYASESYPLTKIGCMGVRQIKNEQIVIDVPSSESIVVSDDKCRKEDLIPPFKYINSEARLLKYDFPDIKRCTRCILPETMPYISFDANGVCNYCNTYTLRNRPKPKEELFELVKPYRRKGTTDCIVPFSGGRDSCYGLHLIVKELGMTPITYTYDWGMVTDLGRRNISRMCAKLGVENIIVADDISKKRKNITKNLKAWLKSPHLGMISILTAGDKHFFRHVETIKRQTSIDLNLWGVNPLEVTHFKAGFLGIPPAFEEKRVYMHGWKKQLEYQKLRFKAMLKSPGYFNPSLWDTLSGEYYRSFTEKKDYYHIFDYWLWDENVIDNTLINEYDWETAVDTSTTWRIGDGTAAFYNYIYYTVAGFTEHDTFRSNQIREGQISREKALELVKDENQPRYQNIRWYLDTLGMNFVDTINTVNSIPVLYSSEYNH